jgi:adenine phosphoribosyltransferase
MNTSSNLSQDVANIIRNIPDFPKEGIQFKDITPLLQNPELLERVVAYFAELYTDKEVTAIVGVESRGFLFGVPLALKMGLPFVLTRKAGKLPAETISLTYDLEYGTATLEIHKDALNENDKVVVVDDLLATGGTAGATIQLIEKLGATVSGCAFVIELDFLNGVETIVSKSQKNPDITIDSLLHY